MSHPLNILWIMTDEQRTDSLGCYGSTWASSPNWDRLAKLSRVYDAAYTPSPVCVPARVALLTGYRPSTCGVMTIHDPLPESHARFLTHSFRDAGYQTASFGKQHYNYPKASAFEHEVFRIRSDKVGPLGYAPDVDTSGLGVTQYAGDEASRWVLGGRYPGGLDDLAEAANTRDAIAWLDQRERDRPFFLRVSFNAPHTPVSVPAPWDTCIDPKNIDLPVDRLGDGSGLPPALHRAMIERSGVHRMADAQIARMRQCYYGLVVALDELVGQLIEALDERGLAQDTLIAFCSDHGTHLGDHGFVQKQSFFEVSARVPFMIHVPGQPGRRSDSPVSTGSLLPTLLSFCGLPVPDDVEYPVLPLGKNTAEPSQSLAVISEISYGERGGRPDDRYVMLRHERWKLTVFRDRCDPGRLPSRDGLMLFDLEADPGERIDLADDPAHDGTIRALLDELACADARGGV